MSDYLISPEVSQAFTGWRLVSGWLQDPAGNIYRPEDLQAAFWARAAWSARAGYPGELRFLRSELERRLRVVDRSMWILDLHRQTATGCVRAGQLRLGLGPVPVTLDLIPMGGNRSLVNER
jgi:hypothetical protein